MARLLRLACVLGVLSALAAPAAAAATAAPKRGLIFNLTEALAAARGSQGASGTDTQDGSNSTGGAWVPAPSPAQGPPAEAPAPQPGLELLPKASAALLPRRLRRCRSTDVVPISWGLYMRSRGGDTLTVPCGATLRFDWTGEYHGVARIKSFK